MLGERWRAPCSHEATIAALDDEAMPVGERDDLMIRVAVLARLRLLPPLIPVLPVRVREDRPAQGQIEASGDALVVPIDVHRAFTRLVVPILPNGPPQDKQSHARCR